MSNLISDGRSIKAFLNKNGIKALVKTSYSASNYGTCSVRVEVVEGDANKAAELLKDVTPAYKPLVQHNIVRIHWGV